MLNKTYWGLGTAMILWYGLNAFMGWESTADEAAAREARATGSWRSSGFWVYGFRGGK